VTQPGLIESSLHDLHVLASFIRRQIKSTLPRELSFVTHQYAQWTSDKRHWPIPSKN